MPTTPDRPADQLRAAAELLRDKATAAIHEGRTTWSTGHTLGSKSPVVVDDQEQPSVLIETYAARLERVNSYLALVGPATGLAVARWLEREAEIWQVIDDASAHPEETGLKVTVGASTHAEALAVARQLLGTTSETTAAALEPQDHPGADLFAALQHAGLDVDEANARMYAYARMVLRQEKATAAPPAPADRAAVLREAAEVAAAFQSDCQNCAVELEVAAGLRRLAGEAAAGAHHTVDGTRYLCHTDDHYCPQPPTTPAVPAAPEETR